MAGSRSESPIIHLLHSCLAGKSLPSFDRFAGGRPTPACAPPARGNPPPTPRPLAGGDYISYPPCEFASVSPSLQGSASVRICTVSPFRAHAIALSTLRVSLNPWQHLPPECTRNGCPLLTGPFKASKPNLGALTQFASTAGQVTPAHDKSVPYAGAAEPLRYFAQNWRQFGDNGSPREPCLQRELAAYLLKDVGFLRENWSGRRDSNPRPQPWQGCALPLSYARSGGRRVYDPRVPAGERRS